MSSKKLKDFSTDVEEITRVFNEICPSGIANGDLRTIFNVALKFDLYFFPDKVLSHDAENLNGYLQKWISGFTSFVLPSLRERTPKSTCSDPAIQKMIKILCDYTDDQASLQSTIHDLFMAAENVQGNLLEEYIADRTKNIGWIWCVGETLRSVDFCSFDGNYLLQIKNKNNTENSSSSAIRIGTSVRKWFRLGSRRENGAYVPDFKWEELNEIVNSKKRPGTEGIICNMNEDDYHSFLEEKLNLNPRILREE